MKTIILVTYETSPYKGSEASVSWNYITHMSPSHRLIVVYGRGKDDVENYLQHNTVDNVIFRHVAPAAIGDGEGLLFDIKYNLAYKRWHKQVYNLVERLIKEQHIDVIHYLNPIGFKEPGYLWKLDVPYVWGPIQGVANRPFALYPALNLKGKIGAICRFIVHNSMLRLLPRVRKAMKKADAILTVVPVAQQQIKRIYHRDTTYLPENAIFKMNVQEPVKYDGGKLRLITIGALIERKGVIILLDALKKVKSNNWHLDVVGTGPLDEMLKSKASEYGLQENITWCGKVPRTEVFDKLKNAHLHVITSLGEGNPTTLWEAMSLGVPTITLDHCGMGAVVCEKCGVKIPIHSYSQVVDELSTRLTAIIQQPQIIDILSEGVLECAKMYMWDERRIKVFDDIYDSIIEKNKDSWAQDRR